MESLLLGRPLAADDAGSAVRKAEIAADAAERRTPTLEKRRDNVSEGGPAVIVSACRCRKRQCKRCGPVLGYAVREVLQSKVDLFGNFRLFTLTVDRQGTTTGRGFGSPGEAHGHVTQKRLIARLMAEIGCDTWACVLEFQKSGGGWPHWHLLVDLSRCPGGKLDLPAVWHWWRDTWKVGGCKLSDLPKCVTRAHALNYLTKYLVKFPEGGFPIWVMNSVERIRFVSASKRIGALVRAGQCSPRTPDDDEFAAMDTDDVDGTSPEGKKRTHLEQVLDCGTTMNLWVRDDADGIVNHRWIGLVDAGFDELLVMLLVKWCPVGSACAVLPDDCSAEAGRPLRIELTFPRTLRAQDLKRWVDRWRHLGPVGQVQRMHRAGVSRADDGHLVWGGSCAA
jgi:hypothetical protein